MNIFKNSNRKRGFSLIEVVIVVAVIGILLAVAVPNIIAYYRELKLVELDDNARTIFMAAQNEISAILAADKDGVPAGHDGSCDYPTSTPVAGVTGGSVDFDYLSTDNVADADSLHKIVPAGSIESELHGNNYVVEYNHETGAVHAVWYWENGTNFDYQKNYTLDPNNADKPHATKDARIKVPVGYYGGGDVDRIAVTQMPIPELTLINAEELQLTIKVPAITDGTSLDEKIRVDVMVNGKTIVKGANLWNGGDPGIVVLDTFKTDYDEVVDPTLHSWTVGAEFKDWVADAGLDVKPGDNITVSVKLYLNGTVGTGTDERTLIPQVASVATNSLFASMTDDGTDKVAEIAYGRHLQNLDNDEYGITKAEQTRNIDFKATGAAADAIYYWGSTYGYETLKFSPINTFVIGNNNNDVNSYKHLTKYDGNTFEIRNLNIKNPYTDPTEKASASLGLFGSLLSTGGSTFEFKNIILVNTKVEEGCNVGALVGQLAGSGSLENCHVYLDEFDATGNGLNSKDPRLIAKTTTPPPMGAVPSAGGLVGMAMASLELNNCSASTIISSTNYAGGLVGGVTDDLTINKSYAACNITGALVGGLVGHSNPDTVVIGDSYAAGTADIDTTAIGNLTSVSGLFNYTGTPTVKEVTNSYAAVRYGDNIIDNNISVDGAYSGAGTGTGGSVYYVEQSGVTYETGSGESKNTSELAGKVGGTEFTAAEGWFVPAGGSKVNPMGLTYPYNTLGTDLADPYPYPMLVADATAGGAAGSAAMEHYGDWLEDAGGDAMMAYIEKYDDGSYGIYAAKKAVDGKVTAVPNSLKDKVVVDDFYRFIGPSDPGEFTLDDGTDKYTFEEETVSDARLQEAIGDGMKVFKPQGATGWDGVKNYYHKIKLDSGTTYLYNPSFACEAFDVTEYVAPDSAGEPTVAIDTDVILEKPDAAGPGESFTDGAGNSNQATGVVIRSARQLANIQAYTTAADAPKDTAGTVYGQTWMYDQLANIVFSGTDGYTGSGLAVGKESGAPLTPAKLTTGKYYGHEKEIKNLYIGNAGTADVGAGLFESVGTDGSLNDMRLVNVSVAGGEALATGGLVGILHGTVDNCGIYVSDATEYSNWTVIGSGTNGVGGLIGEISSNAEAKSSFAAVNVEGTAETATPIATNPVGGFVGQFGGGTIENCYAGGYVDATSKTYENNSVNVKGKNNVGGFVGSISTSTVTFEGINYSTASVGGPNHDQVGLFAGAVATNFSVDKTTVMLNAVAKAFKAETTGSVTTYTDEAPRDESEYMGGTAQGSKPTEKVPYNQDVAIEFPFPSGQTVHHGDWINVEVMGLYYDTVMDPATGDTTTGYYANGDVVNGTIDGVSMAPLATGTPGSGEIATDDGYMFVTVENLGDISIRVGEKSFPMKPVELNPTMEINGKTYNFKYEVPAEALNTPTVNYYNAVSINGKMFYANFGVAGEIFDSVTDPNKPMAKSGIKYTTVDAGVTKTEELKDSASTGYTGVVVRSARQLANIGIRSNMGEYDATNTKVYTKEAVAIQEAKISQVLDIDYAKYAEATKYTNAAGEDVSKIPEAVVLDGSYGDANHTPITINGGGYYGNNYEIRNLIPGMIRQITSVDGSNAVKEVLIQSGLVGRITKGEIKDVTLINATVENDAQKAVSVSSSSSGSSGSSGSTGGEVHVIDEAFLNSLTDFKGSKKVDDVVAINWKDATGTSTPSSIGKKSLKWEKGTTTVLDAESYINFGGKSSKDASNISLKFSTAGEKVIKVWWSASDVLRELCLYDKDFKQLEKKTASTANLPVLSAFTISASASSTYYIGGVSGKNVPSIYRIEVYESATGVDVDDPTPYKEPTPTPGPTAPIEPGKDKFPDGVDSDKFKARFGALAGAVNPVDKSDPDCVKIENCGVYVEPDSGTDTAAYTTAYNKYSVKNTGTTGFKEDTVGGLIGMATQGTTIEKSYAAVKVEGGYYVGGFAGYLKDVTVSNCYSGGHTKEGVYDTTDYNVTANNVKSGAAGGFVGTIEATDASTLIFNGVCYSTSSASCPADEDNSDEKGTVGNFAGLIKDSKGTWQGFKGASIYGIGIMNGDNRTDEREYLDVTVTMHAYTTAGISAKPYDVNALVKSGNPVYPYEVSTDGQAIHHGDWPMRYNLIYYELYKDKGNDFTDSIGQTLKNRVLPLNDEIDGAQYLGLYGVLPSPTHPDGLTINTLRVDGAVYKSGYMLISDLNVDKIRLDINSYYADSSQRLQQSKEVNGENTNIKDTGYYDKPGVAQPKHTTVAECTTKIDFSQYDIEDESGNMQDAEIYLGGGFGYIIPDVVLNVAASEDIYVDTQINGQTYLFNPQFPCEAVNVDIDHSVKGEVDYSTIRAKPGINYVEKTDSGDILHINEPVPEGTLIIRSPLNLAGLVRYSREANNGHVKNKIVSADFVQHLDVDYDTYMDGVIYDGNTKNRYPAQEKDVTDRDSLDNPIYKYYTGQSGYGQAPAILKGGSYNGYNHTIKGLYLSNDSTDNNFVGLFSTLENATVEKLKLENINVTCDKYNGTIDVGTLAASVSNSTISNVTIDGVTISLDDEENGHTDGDKDNSFHGKNVYESVGGAIGKIDDKTGTTKVENVTVIDPSITVSQKNKENDKLKVGGVIGSADGNTYTYSATATGTDTRSVNITDSGVYMSETNKGEFNDMGVVASGAKLEKDNAGGFAGFLGKGVNVTKDYSAIRVEGVTYAGGFAGHIQGSHVEDCYSGGYVEAATGDYSTSEYNVTGKTAGGFAGKIQVAYESTDGIGQPMAMYMTGVNYTTSSAKGTTQVGVFAGEAKDEAAEALAEKMGGNAPVNYAGGIVDVETGGTKNTEKHVKTGSAIPRKDNKSGFDTYKYNAKDDIFPYDTNQDAHHGDWVDSPLNAVGYWEVENGLLRLWYIPSDAADTPVELTETGALGFGHDSRDAVGITESGYFVVSSDTGATFDSITETKMDMTTASGLGKRIKDMLGGDTVAVQAYELHSGKSDNQTWEVNDESFTVNPAYAKAVEHGNSTTMGASATEAYEIRTVAQLQNMATAENTKFFKQTHDIVFEAGGSYTSVKDFKGHFDGGSYRILDTTKPVFASLAEGATVDNVIVYAPQGYTSKTIDGNGGLAASSSGKVEISNTIVAGFTISNSGNVGGIVGEVTSGELTISNSEATNKLTGNSSSSNVGGLVGYVGNGATLNVVKSYAGGAIEGSKKVSAAGGLVGDAATPGNVKYDYVYSYVNMMSASANKFYGIGPGSVAADSKISEYWATGLDGKDAEDTDAKIEDVTLAWMKVDTQALNNKPDSVTVEEYLKPDTDRTKGLENLANGKSTDTEKFGVFPFAAFVTDKDASTVMNYHYGDFPVAEYVGLYYYEKEVIFDKDHAMVTDPTTGKITNENDARTEYHYYAYGGELYDKDGDGTAELYGQRVLDTLCYDHHLTGEYAYIAEYGYGVFYPESAGYFRATIAGSVKELDTYGTTLTSGNPIYDNLLNALDVTTGNNMTVHLLPASGEYLDEQWKLEFFPDEDHKGSKELLGSVDMRVNTAFGGAIASKFGKDGLGDDKLEGEPVQVRTMQQFQNLTTISKIDESLEHFAITHDVNGRGFVDANTPGATGYVVNNEPHCNILEGKGYRILDLNIKAESGDVALFKSWKRSSTSLLSGVILYSTDGKGEISTKSGDAAGLVVSTGRNVKDCVVSGYTISGTGYVGGIASQLDLGSSYKVNNCQAIVTLKHTGNSTSDTGIGGIAGKTGSTTIENCYVGGSITINKNGVLVGGIFGTGSPKLNKCYSYMDLRDTGATSNVYAIGKGATITDCYYLTEYATGASTTSQGTGKTFDEMCNEKGTDDAKFVYVPNGSDPVDGLTSWGAGAYPMAAKVTVSVRAGVDTGIDETDDVLVHYGDWPYSTRAAGIAYWEKDGDEYFFNAVWVNHSGDVKTYKDICTKNHVNETTGKIEEHKITDSGYVFFTTNKDLEITLPTHEVTTSSSGGSTTKTVGVYDSSLSEATDKANVISALEKKLKVKCLDGETTVYSNEVFATGGVVDATSTVTLTKDDGSTVEKTFYCNPGMSGVANKSFRDTYKVQKVDGKDIEVVDVASGLYIEIRTVEQLDNIPDNVLKGFHFQQTHDLYGDPTGGTKYSGYTGAVDFAGTYDGQGYKILDLSMSGADKDVGLFASINANTCELRNIIMYAPNGANGATISGTGTKGVDATDDHYGVGGLVGSIGSGSSATAKIENCVVAGYTIKGEQYVGGLIGWGYHGATIKNCAAVNDIECTTIVATQDNANGADNSGAGGILGGYGSNSAGKTEITNCYTGGTIKVSGDNASNAIVGGICGKNGNTSDHAKVTNCYTYVDLHDCAKAKVSVISSSENSSNSKNYYLNDSARIPNWVHKQGEGKTYDELKSVLSGTDFGTATKSYVTGAGDTGWTPSTTAYPFPEVVRTVKGYEPDGSTIYGDFVHYGEWPENNPTPTPSSYPWEDGKIGVILGYSSSSTFGNDSDVVAYMFKNDHAYKGMIGSTSKSTINNYIGLVIGDSNNGLDTNLRNHLRVLYYDSSSGKYDISADGKTLTIKGKCTAVYEFSSGTEVGRFNNSSEFGGYKMYGIKPTKTTSSDTTDVTITTNGGELLVLVYDSGVDANTLNISTDNIIGWVKVSDLDAKKTGTGAAGSSPATPEGPGFEGAMAPAVTEAIMPEKFKLPEPENIDENGDDGHTQVVGGRMSVAKVRRVR